MQRLFGKKVLYRGDPAFIIGMDGQGQEIPDDRETVDIRELRNDSVIFDVKVADLTPVEP